MPNPDGGDNLVSYVVGAGERLSDIARRYGVDERTIYEHERNRALRERRADPADIRPGDQVWVPVDGREAGTTIQTGGRHTLRTPRWRVALESITFASAHHIMSKNYINPDTADRAYRRFDWACSEAPYSPPEWERGRSAPVSHSRGQELQLEVVLRVRESQGVEPLQGSVVGQPVDGSDAAFTFQSEERTFGTGVHTLQLRGERPLPNWPTCLKRRIRWSLQMEAGAIPLGISGRHVVYVTFCPPIEKGEPEDGATRARMQAATQRVGAAHSPDSVTLIRKLFDRFSEYVLQFEDLPSDKRRAVEDNPDLKEYMGEVGWPDFLTYESQRFPQGQGGAWPLAVLEQFGGDCQAIVRFIRGILTQLGHDDGTLAIRYVTTNPKDPGSVCIRSSPLSIPEGPVPNLGYALTDTPLTENRQYPEAAAKLNAYESFLRYRYEENGRTYQAWYGGGVGLMGPVAEEEGGGERAEGRRLPNWFKQRLLRESFDGLVEYEYVDTPLQTTIQVKRYWSFSDVYSAYSQGGRPRR